MDHRETRKILSGNLRWFLRHEEALPRSPRPYQLEALAILADWLGDPGGTRRGYVAWATGLGKTYLYALLARYAVGLRILIIVPSKVLIVQTARAIHPFTGGMLGHLSSLEEIRDEQDRVIATRGHFGHSLVITTDTSFKLRDAEIASSYAPHVIIRDECHWGYSERSLEALDRFPDALVIGFSATPDYVGTVNRGGYAALTLESGLTLYGDTRRFARTHFGTCLDVRSARWGIDAGWLAPLAWGQLGVEVDFSTVRIVAGPAGFDYEEDGMQRAMHGAWPDICRMIADLFTDGVFKGMPVFAVCPGVAAAEALAKAVSARGIQTRSIFGETPDGPRDAALQAFERGEIPLITSVNVLREGWDSPNATVCLMLRPLLTGVGYLQPVGRILRRTEDHPGKVALGIDIQGRSQRPGLSMPHLYGRPGETYGTGGSAVIGPMPESGPPFSLPACLRAPHTLVGELKVSEACRDYFVSQGQTWITSRGLARLYELDLGDLLRKLLPHAKLLEQRNRPADPVRRQHYCLDDVRKILGEPKRLTVEI